ncbi:tetratricopeptide repeat protein [Radiobacillus kanasensis]|uniref:tetratricopeptide repeat protein n=1 Tax=Radiobacillus kanasensis TaxID=2844358 RepID=UPI001E50EE1E|nr:tetratricopeptide repeat protein [Radiobacillus kanasensis]UFU00125.1 tetratricopeptide repeat protein [Radiobacillus kanasensis]
MEDKEREQIEKGRDLLAKGKPQEAIKFFQKLTKEPNVSGEVYLYAGMTYDNIGNEKDAIPLYIKALNKGIENEKELRDCYVCLASSYRIEGELTTSLSYLTEAKERFPTDAVISTFLALTLFDMKEFRKTVKELGNTLLDESNNQELMNFEKPLRQYFNNI